MRSFEKQLRFMRKWRNSNNCRKAPLEIIFQEQSYSSLHSRQSFAWDHFRGDIANPCSVSVDFCAVIADRCGVIAIHKA